MYGNNYKFLHAAFALLLAASLFAGAQQHPQNNWIRQSVDLAINNRFTEAESLLTRRIAQNDSSAESWFYLASVLNSKMNYYENTIDARPYIKTLQTLLQKSEALLFAAKGNTVLQARALFFRGSAYGYLAFYQSKTGAYFHALSNGLSSINDLEEAVQLDSTLYDAYLGIGAYQYWRSTKFKHLFWVPFVEDLRLQGIGNIRKAIQKSRYSRYLAMHQMIYVLTNYGEMDEALGYARQAVSAFPNSVFMRWAYAHTLYKRHEYPQALQAFDALARLLQTTEEKNPSHLVECYTKMAEIYLKSHQEAKSKELARRALDQAKGKTLSREGRESVAQAEHYLGINP